MGKKRKGKERRNRGYRGKNRVPNTIIQPKIQLVPNQPELSLNNEVLITDNNAEPHVEKLGFEAKSQKTRKGKKRKMSNHDQNTVTKKAKQFPGSDKVAKSEKSDVETMVEPLSVDMSKISSPKRPVTPVSLSDIQNVLLFSLLGPSRARLPTWATLDHKQVKQVVVVLLKYVTPTLFTEYENCFPKLATMFDVVLQFESSGNKMHIKSPVYSLLTVPAKPQRNKGKVEEANNIPVEKTHYVLTETEMIKNDFMIPGLSPDARDFITISNCSETVATSSSPMFALDCEMCLSAAGRVLTRISVVNESNDVVYDTLVKPEQPIIDYLTRFSGITEEDLKDVEITLQDVQDKLKEIIPADGILVGHSLEFDFNSLKFFHNKVIDTSVVFSDHRGFNFKPSLKYLASKYLKTEIQNDANGHCSIEDARTCMKLVQLKIRKSPKFGNLKSRGEKCLVDIISENSENKATLVDRASNVKLWSGNSDAFPIATDEEVVSKVVNLLPKYQFIWSQLHNVETIRADKRTTTSREAIKPILEEMDGNVSTIHDNLEDGTLFVVILGSADTSLIGRLRNNGTERKKLKEAEKDVMTGLCFMKFVNKTAESQNT